MKKRHLVLVAAAGTVFSVLSASEMGLLAMEQSGSSLYEHSGVVVLILLTGLFLGVVWLSAHWFVLSSGRRSRRSLYQSAAVSRLQDVSVSSGGIYASSVRRNSRQEVERKLDRHHSLDRKLPLLATTVAYALLIFFGYSMLLAGSVDQAGYRGQTLLFLLIALSVLFSAVEVARRKNRAVRCGVGQCVAAVFLVSIRRSPGLPATDFCFLDDLAAGRKKGLWRIV